MKGAKMFFVVFFLFTGLVLTASREKDYDDDDGVWNPYQMAEITVKNTGGTVLALTRTTVPTSDEISCSSCHGANAFDDILTKHDALHETTLASSKPILCANCHLSPAYGNIAGSEMYLSKAIHGSHSGRGASCYDCHPGAITKCNRSLAHNNSSAADGNCITSQINTRVERLKPLEAVACVIAVQGEIATWMVFQKSMGH